jgi:hypothetical protein
MTAPGGLEPEASVAVSDSDDTGKANEVLSVTECAGGWNMFKYALMTLVLATMLGGGIAQAAGGSAAGAGSTGVGSGGAAASATTGLGVGATTGGSSVGGAASTGTAQSSPGSVMIPGSGTNGTLMNNGNGTSSLMVPGQASQTVPNSR